jgi:hypothetical protein
MNTGHPLEEVGQQFSLMLREGIWRIEAKALRHSVIYYRYSELF